jgi:hypothetical protein
VSNVGYLLGQLLIHDTIPRPFGLYLAFPGDGNPPVLGRASPADPKGHRSTGRTLIA